MSIDGYHKYKRCINSIVFIREITLASRLDVPYITYLLLIYDTYIAPENSIFMRAVIYIYEYIYKGFGGLNVVVSATELYFLVLKVTMWLLCVLHVVVMNGANYFMVEKV